MGKRKFGIAAALIGILMIVGGFLLDGRSESGGLEWNSTWSHTISVKDGVTESKYANGNFMVDKAGKYRLNLTWHSVDHEVGPGFVTGCVITDEWGRLLYATSDIQGDVSPELELKAGAYHLDYFFLTSEKEFLDYAKTWLCGQVQAKLLAEKYEFRNFLKNGTWNMEFTLHSKKAVALNTYSAVGYFAIILGFVLVVLAVLDVVKHRGLAYQRYDERQELEQGRGFRCAFFSMLVSLGVVLMLDSMGDLPDGVGGIFYAACLFIALAVYVVYCIWHDCYIALNEKRGVIIVILGSIGIINLVIGLSGVLSRGLYDAAGRFSPNVLNLMCAAVMLVIVIAGVARSIRSRHENRAEEEDLA